ncbi:class I SAM-dependent methyltransferase [Methylotetracoccus oryzae]|uniref:class I SAM-dependent methyltransferase n=1 Tax=Methylotetracoccus oryzae TaxID=1919059 RepID=UPI001118054F|nr:class I SAM-dependent methyltransferase [Methylotetracoccus oryzae]
MSEALLDAWNERYRARGGSPSEACRVLVDNAHLLPPGGEALDLACGTGGNALFLARRGLTVYAWDLALNAVNALRSAARLEASAIHAQACDIDTVAWSADRFDVIVVSRYLDRALAPHLCDSLRPGGLLFYQTFTAAKLDAAGPRNPAFLLDDNELLALFGSLKVRYYREDSRCGDLAVGLRNEAYFVGQKAAADRAAPAEDA